MRDANSTGHFAGVSTRFAIMAVMILSVAGAVPAMAEPPRSAFQLSFVDPLQVIAQERSIAGFRFSLLRGANRDMIGVDLSGMATVTDGSLRGLQISVANKVDGAVTGLQIAAFMNAVQGELRGVQISAVTSEAGGGAGAQIAPIYAETGKMRGFQFGIVTRAEELVGLQIGLLNFNRKGFLPVFPIFNIGY
jgi:hypothetical protein